MSREKPKVLLAMSGGLDSSVAALLLKAQSYSLVGITMKTWDYEDSPSENAESGCCSLDSINDARSLAVKNDFPHYVIDIRDEFDKYIITDFVDEYMAGRTPNPCVLCNTHIKWTALLKKADQLGCEYIATGHYARVLEENGRYFVAKGKDQSKDQSYMLWGVSQENLKRTLLPLGGYQKDEIREIARKSGFERIAQKRESYEICFVPDDDYRRFLRHRLPDIDLKLNGGNFVDVEGNVLGQHKGYPFYTIGQRKGLEIALGKPMYVKEIRAESNEVVLSEADQLGRFMMKIRGVSFSKYEQIPEDKLFRIKVRYHDKGTLAKVFHENDMLRIEFEEEVRAITPGQSAVVYEGEDVVAGGFIV